MLEQTPVFEKLVLPDLPDLPLHPGLQNQAPDVLTNSANFVVDSQLDILSVSGPNSDIKFKIRVDSTDSLRRCAKLEADDNATYSQKTCMSRSLAMKIFQRFDINAAFLLDLVGRPNYWSAFSQVKSDREEKKDVYEFFCQHPRWHQKGRYDKMKAGATQGNKAPCSIYMNYSVAKNQTIYLVAAPDDGIWFSFLETINVSNSVTDGSLISPKELASSPFMVHALISNVAFEQATEYAAQVRNRLMTQLKRVNDYADNQAEGNPIKTGDQDARSQLQRITIELHQVSQMLNTGLASAQSSMRLSEKFVQAHALFCERTKQGSPGTSISRTQSAFQYVKDAFEYHNSWLKSYKTRKETAMNFVFNMVTQQDSSTNLTMSHRMSEDSSSMHSITILTMIFLPGTFTATLFSTVAFRASDAGDAEITAWLLPFCVVTGVLTLVVLAIWYFRKGFGSWRLSMLKWYGRRQKAAGTRYQSGMMV
ncbi:unnamed protein product [Clonostachys rosea]|uniref:Uncharacterized protein n=1 Tax=Bionectria ochroleuca TaxID=29856 RepID=A0ABY6U8C7_BIOOC|nr:unnamed protein product [Clonostachys rosea]